MSQPRRVPPLRPPPPPPRVVRKIVCEDPDSHASEIPVEYRIEQRRRTVIITTSVPPDQWDDDTLQQISSELARIPEVHHSSACSNPTTFRRAKSCSPPDVTSVEQEEPSSVPPDMAGSNHPYQHYKQPSLSAITLPERRKRNSYPSSPQRASRSRHPPPREQIYFYHRKDPHYGFTNFSPHSVFYKGKVYPTSEHLFQSFKFQEHRPLLAEHIRTFSDKPSMALSEARRFQPEVRPDWMRVNVEKMDETLWHKFQQHADLKQELLDTGDAELIEDSDKDSFWGVGPDRKGRNELGKALERLRSKFRGE